MATTTFNISNLEEFFALHASELTSQAGIVYRGHGDAEKWKLESSRSRSQNKTPWAPLLKNSAPLEDFIHNIFEFGPRETRAIAQKAMERPNRLKTRDRLIKALKAPIKTSTEGDLIAILREQEEMAHIHDPLEMLGQHHGLPTNLLDFSYSPFIAWYFALSAVTELDQKPCIYSLPADPSSDVLGRIGELNANRLRQQLEPSGSEIATQAVEVVDAEALADCLLCTSAKGFDHDNERKAAQLGHLIHVPLGEDLEQLFERAQVRLEIKKYVLTNQDIPKGMKLLRLMNIHAGALFTGVEGAAMLGRDGCQFRGYGTPRWSKI